MPPFDVDNGVRRLHGRAVLSIGDKAPDFEGIDQFGKRWTLDELVKDGSIVLYFYPKDFTPVCTKEACLFRDAHEELAKGGISVVGVSTDDAETHAKFAERHRLPFPLLSDPDKRISSAYGARQVLGLFSRRVTYVIDRQKRVRGAFHHELSAQRHLDDVRRVVASS
jgi:peroxiredoxin Q/BCP